MPALAAVVGLLIGSVPSADAVARARGIDLRAGGSGNPGTANALRLGGRSTAAMVLAIDLAKGVTAVAVGRALAGDGGGLLAGGLAIAGQVVNPWFLGRGGKGLGVAGGVTLAAWPVPLPGLLAVIGAGATLAGAAAGALTALATYATFGLLWWQADLPTAWGVAPSARLAGFAVAVALGLSVKFAIDLRQRSRR